MILQILFSGIAYYFPGAGVCLRNGYLLYQKRTLHSNNHLHVY